MHHSRCKKMNAVILDRYVGEIEQVRSASLFKNKYLVIIMAVEFGGIICIAVNQCFELKWKGGKLIVAKTVCLDKMGHVLGNDCVKLFPSGEKKKPFEKIEGPPSKVKPSKKTFLKIFY